MSLLNFIFILYLIGFTCLQMGPDPTWPSENKRPTRLWPGYFLTQPRRFFLIRREKIEKFGIFRGNFPNLDPNQRWLTQHKRPKFDPARTGSKMFDLVLLLLLSHCTFYCFLFYRPLIPFFSNDLAG